MQNHFSHVNLRARQIYEIWGVFLYANIRAPRSVNTASQLRTYALLSHRKYFPVATSYTYSCYNLYSIQAPARLPGIPSSSSPINYRVASSP